MGSLLAKQKEVPPDIVKKWTCGLIRMLLDLS
jgi:hypothetical protein